MTLTKGLMQMGKTAKTVQAVRPRRLDRRNPFGWWTRRNGYFSAFLAGGGRTTREALIAGCLKTRQACGITDSPPAVSKDVSDHVYKWRMDARGTGYKLAVQVSEDGTITCTHVDGVPWAEYIKGKVR